MKPSIRNPQLERLLFRYSAALDRGDIEAITAILELAEHDPVLSAHLAGIDAAFSAELDHVPIVHRPTVLTLNRNHIDEQGYFTMTTTSLPRRLTAQTPLHGLSLAAGLIVFLFVLILASTTQMPPVNTGAQTDQSATGTPPALPTSSPLKSYYIVYDVIEKNLNVPPGVISTSELRVYFRSPNQMRIERYTDDAKGSVEAVVTAAAIDISPASPSTLNYVLTSDGQTAYEYPGINASLTRLSMSAVEDTVTQFSPQNLNTQDETQLLASTAFLYGVKVSQVQRLPDETLLDRSQYVFEITLEDARILKVMRDQQTGLETFFVQRVGTDQPDYLRIATRLITDPTLEDSLFRLKIEPSAATLLKETKILTPIRYFEERLESVPFTIWQPGVDRTIDLDLIQVSVEHDVLNEVVKVTYVKLDQLYGGTSGSPALTLYQAASLSPLGRFDDQVNISMLAPTNDSECKVYEPRRNGQYVCYILAGTTYVAMHADPAVLTPEQLSFIAVSPDRQSPRTESDIEANRLYFQWESVKSSAEFSVYQPRMFSGPCLAALVDYTGYKHSDICTRVIPRYPIYDADLKVVTQGYDFRDVEPNNFKPAFNPNVMLIIPDVTAMFLTQGEYARVSYATGGLYGLRSAEYALNSEQTLFYREIDGIHHVLLIRGETVTHIQARKTYLFTGISKDHLLAMVATII